MERAAEAIREVVSTTVLFGIRDPRVKNVTVLGAEVTQDLRAAKIFVTIMGDAKAQSLAMHGLNSARGFIQSKVADRLQTKHTPVISFVLDPSVKKSIEISRALQGLVKGTSTAEESANESAEQADFQESESDHDGELLSGEPLNAPDNSDQPASVPHTGPNE